MISRKAIRKVLKAEEERNHTSLNKDELEYLVNFIYDSFKDIDEDEEENLEDSIFELMEGCDDSEPLDVWVKLENYL